MTSKEYDDYMRENYFSGRNFIENKLVMDSRQDLMKLMANHPNSPPASDNKQSKYSRHSESINKLVDIHKLSEQAMLEIDEMY